MRLLIERMNHTAEGIALYKNIVHFVPKTIPGDIIEVKNKDIISKKNYNIVTNYQLITPSTKRVKITCPYYKECGGCQLLGLNKKEQLNYKKEKVIDIFKKYTNLDINPDIISTNQYHYRNKITLHVKDGKLGLFEKKTNKIILIKKCLLVSNEINNIIPIIQKKINITNVKQIIIKQMQTNIMIQFLGKINKEEVIQKLSKYTTSIYENDNLIYGKKYLEETLSNYKFYISPNSFFQINHEGTIKIYDKVKEYLEEKNNNVLDLYCGTGSIGIYVSEYCKKITGIEINESSVNNANKNIKENKIKNIHILKGNVSSILKNDNLYDAIIIDPPRSGLDNKTKETLLKIKSKKIIYVSCNPLTLARDINTLKELYDLKEITLVDMFPNTYHVESITILERK